MSRIKKNGSENAELNDRQESVVEKTHSVDELLHDGHPNPDFYPKDGEGFENFQAALDRLSLWGDYFGKLYRVKPLRNPEDKPPRLEKFANTVTLDYIRKTYGGRKFSAWLSRRVGTKDWIVGKFQFDVEAEPVWQDGIDGNATAAAKQAAANAPEGNTQLMNLFGRVIDDALKVREAAAQEGKNVSTADAIREAMEIHGEASKAAIAMVKEQASSDGSTTMKMVMTMMEKFMERRESKIESLLIEKLIDRAFNPAQAADPLEQLNKILDIAEKMKGGGRSSGGDWAGVAQSLVGSLPDLLKTGKELVQTAAIARGMGGPLQRPGLPAAQPPASTVPGTPPSVRPGPAAAVSNPESRAPGPEPEITEQQANLVVQNAIKLMLIRKLFAGETGDSAAEVADAMHAPFAEHLSMVLKTDYGQLAADEILSQCATHPNVLAFCKEYISYFDEEPPGAGAPDVPIPPKAVN